jgi:hypothetical protein
MFVRRFLLVNKFATMAGWLANMPTSMLFYAKTISFVLSVIYPPTEYEGILDVPEV